jgi:hypothetical protein
MQMLRLLSDCAVARNPHQSDLFGSVTDDRYPQVPGAKAEGTSREAAVRIAPLAGRLRRLALAEYGSAGDRGLTADQCANLLGESVLAVRPRVTELRAAGMIEPTSERRANDSGMAATVLAITSMGREALS